MTGLSRNHRAARAYAEQGIAVFPLAPDSKVPLKGSHGELDGTTDPAKVDEMFAGNPNLLVAVALRFTPYFVLDTDARHCGDEWLRSFPELPHTPTAISGSGWPSTHSWFRRTAELDDVHVRVLTPSANYRTGIDVKGLRAGYVVLPPSRHQSGRCYEWEASCRFGEVPIADPPAWLVEMLRRRAVRLAAKTEHATSVDPESFYLGALFKRAGMLGREVRHGVFAVRCPNEAAHSKKSRTIDGSSVVFAPAKAGGRGTFYCAHTSGCSEVFR